MLLPMPLPMPLPGPPPPGHPRHAEERAMQNAAAARLAEAERARAAVEGAAALGETG